MSYKKISRQILKNNDIRPNKLLGQNFLRDKNVLRQIIVAANLSKDDTVLEVGPGEGILTEALARPAGRVVAVEKDKNLAARLKAKFANNKNVEIVEGDILSFLRKQESRAWIPGQACPPSLRSGVSRRARDDSLLPLKPYKVVANIPYYLTSHLIRLLLESANPPSDIVLMVQKEVAQRICACPPKMSLLSVSVQFYAEPKIIASVPKSAFWPQPKVDSAIIRITPRQQYSAHPKSVIPAQAGIQAPIDQLSIEQLDNLNPGFRLKAGMTKMEVGNFFKILHAGFSHPRKQLLGNLSKELKIAKEKISLALAKAGIKNSQRAETLTIENWITLIKFLEP